MRRRKTDADKAELERRAERRAARAERARDLPAKRTFRPKPTTTDVTKTKAAAEKRKRKQARRFKESANGGWR